MSKKLLLIALMMTFVFAASVVMAQDDDTAPADDDTAPAEDPFGLSGTANGEFPVELGAGAEYTFAFEVFNESGGTEAIKKVDITLPSLNYGFDPEALTAPDAIVHEGEDPGVWEAAYDADTGMITWEFTGAVSSVEIGNIRETEMLTFSFIATTDDVDGKATDGFAWALTGDAEEATVVQGIFVFNADDDDDDDTTDDDDDDDDSGGCGC